MSETRIKIPSEMLKAAIAAVDKPNLSYEKNVSLRVEAALRWLRDYGHTLLNDVQLKELHDEWHSDKDNSGKHFYRWVINEALHRMFNEPKPGATCMIETPMVFTIPGSGRYSIGVDYGNGEDESVAVVIRVGENGKPDEQVATLHRDIITKEWVEETSSNPAVDQLDIAEKALLDAADKQFIALYAIATDKGCLAGLPDKLHKTIHAAFEALRQDRKAGSK